jgi:hypothetical protein
MLLNLTSADVSMKINFFRQQYPHIRAHQPKHRLLLRPISLEEMSSAQFCGIRIFAFLGTLGFIQRHWWRGTDTKSCRTLSRSVPATCVSIRSCVKVNDCQL